MTNNKIKMLPNRATICLVMIVKDEEDVIERCLTAVAPYIDYYVISDTGSTDNTKQIISDFFEKQNIPGKIYDDPWENFGHNRSLVLKHAETAPTDYRFTMDADDTLVGELIINKTNLPNKWLDAYNVVIKQANIEYIRTNLFKTELPWQYIGVLHEYPQLKSEKPIDIGLIPSEQFYIICSTSEGGRTKKSGNLQEKYKKDAEILLKEAIRNPECSRTAFYLAQSYRDSAQIEKAMEWYEKRAIMPNTWKEEVYISYLNLARFYPENSPKRKEYLIKAFEAVPRLEALAELMKYYRVVEQNYHASFEIGVRGLHLKFNPTFHLFSEKFAYDFAYFDEMSLAAYYAENLKGLALDMINRMTNIPLHEKERIAKNITFFENA